MIESLDARRLRTLAPHVVAQRERKPPNDLAFSCRERAGKTFQNRTISREAVSCNAGLGRAVTVGVVLSSGIGITSYLLEVQTTLWEQFQSTNSTNTFGTGGD